jgi:uncharacterized protein
MRSRFSGLLALALAGVIVFVIPGFAYPADDVAVPPLTAAIVDTTGTLTAPDIAAIDADLKAFAKRKGSQVAVLMVSSTKPEAIEQYSIRVAEAWKIGRAKVDDGVILVIAKDDRALRIEVGYGLEGAIPDAIAKRVISENIAPRFRAGDFAGGIKNGTATLMKLIDGEKLPAPEFVPPQSDKSMFDLVVPLIVAVFAGSVLISMMGRVKGAAVAGLGFGVAAWWIMGTLLVAGIGAFVAFFLALANGASGRMLGGNHWGGGGGGGWGGGSSGSSDSFSGGGGGFGGGGASGSW